MFEPVKVPLGRKLLQAFGLLSAVLVTSGIIVALAFRYLQSPNEKRMNTQLTYLQDKYDLLKNDLHKTQDDLSELEKRDNDVYRQK